MQPSYVLKCACELERSQGQSMRLAEGGGPAVIPSDRLLCDRHDVSVSRGSYSIGNGTSRVGRLKAGSANAPQKPQATTRRRQRQRAMNSERGLPATQP